MAKKQNDESGVQPVKCKAGDAFTLKRSGTVVNVTLVHEDGTVDVQEPDGAKRYWGGVAANSGALLAAE